MRTFANTTKLDDTDARSSAERAPGPIVSPDARHALTIARKASCSCGGGCPSCRSNSGNLKVSHPNDAAEIEADRIAERVMRMPAGEARTITASNEASNQIHRTCNSCEDEEETTVQRKTIPNTDGVTSKSPSHVRDAISSGAQPLDLEARNFFEPRFGYDLSNIRIHADSTAGRSAQRIDAKAYTLGNDIVFAAGEYNPETQSGKELIAHELAHTIQAKHSSGNIHRKSFGDQDKIHGPIEDKFCRETGNCEGGHHSEEYADWITAIERLENFKITGKDLKYSRVTQKFEQMSLEELHEYRSNYITSESDPPGEYPHDPAVVKYLTDLMMSRPTQQCTKEEAEKAEKRAQQAVKDAGPMVDGALKAITRLLSSWSSNKQSLTSGTSIHTGEVACAFRSNFNLNESDPTWGTTAIKVESKLLWLQKRLKMPVSFACEPINSRVCLEATGRDAEAYVVNHTGPIHLCYSFRSSPIDPVSTIIHEMLHFRSGLKDQGGYAKFSTMAMTCKPGVQFTATPDVLTNTADSITGFIMHINSTSSTDLQVVTSPKP